MSWLEKTVDGVEKGPLNEDSRPAINPERYLYFLRFSRSDQTQDERFRGGHPPVVPFSTNSLFKPTTICLG